MQLSEDEKLDLLDQYRNDEDLELGDKQFEVLRELAFDEDSYIRSEVAALLVNYPTMAAKDLLLRLAQDHDWFTRLQAYDSLSHFHIKEVQDFLVNALQHEHNTPARGYIILSLADIGADLCKDHEAQLPKIKRAAARARSPRTKLSYCYMLYCFGDPDILQEWLSYLNYPEPYVKCWVIAGMYDVIDEGNAALITGAIKKLLQKEEDDDVRETAQTFLERYQDAAAHNDVCKLGTRDDTYLSEAHPGR